MKKFYTILLSSSFSLMAIGMHAQGTLSGTQKEGLMQSFPAELKQIQQRYNDNAQFTLAFRSYYNSIFSSDKKNYDVQIMQNKLNAAQAKAYISKLDFKYDSLHAMFSHMAIENPALLTYKTPQTKQTFNTCYAVDSNMTFAQGILSGWYAYYAENNATQYNFATTGITGGLCSAITGAANDPNTNIFGNPANTDYQVSVESSQFDSLVPSVPIVPPGFKYAARLGDSTNPNQGVGMLTQSFMVTPANQNFSYSYSLFLENPYIGHSYYERPYFHFVVLDQNGDTIPGTNTILSSYDLQKKGYDSVFYLLDSDYVYYTGWQNARLSLSQYAGQCVTISASVYDCSEGAHFGYGYFIFSKDSLLIQPSYPTLCGNNPITLTAPYSLRYLWSGPAGGIIGSDTLGTISVNQPGKYSVITTTGKAGAYTYDTLYYTLNTGTRAANAKTTNYYCNAKGGTAAALPFGTGPFSYVWSTGQTSSSVLSLVPGTYSFQATDATGCTSIDTFAITTAPPIKIQDSATKRIVEPGDSVLLIATINSTDTGFTYSWAPALSVSNPNSAKTYAHPTATTIYTVTVNWACGTLTDTITIFKGCTMASTVSTTYHCYDLVTVATALPTKGVPPYNYKWSNTVTSNIDSAFVTPSNSSYYLIVKDSNGCKDSVTFTVDQPNKLKVASAYALPVSCHNLCNGQMGISLSGGLAPYTYKWSAGASGTYVASNLCAGTYTVTATDANGCQVDTSATVINPAYYKITVTDSVKLGNCTTNSNVCLKATGGVAPYTYYWNGLNYGNCRYAVTPGIYTVNVKDNNSCVDTAIFNITEGPILATITQSPANSILCTGTSVVLTANAAGGCGVYKYNWSATYGGSGIFSPNDSAASVTVILKNPTVFYLKVTDTTGCTTTSSVSDVIYTDPWVSVRVTGTDTIISGDSVKLTATASGGGGYGYKYRWQPGGDTTNVLKTILNNSEQFTVTASDGCALSAGKDSVKVIVDTLIKLNICGNDPTTLKVPVGATAYTWSGPGIIGANNTQSVKANMPGRYTVIVTNPSGILRTDTIYYLLTSITPPAKVTSAPYYCNGTKGSAIASPYGIAPFTYTWSNGQTTDTISNLMPGTYTLNASDGYGCLSVDTFSIPSYIIPLTITTSTHIIEPGDSILLTVIAAGADSSTTYSWVPSVTVTHPNSASTYVHPISTTTYTVTVSSPCGPLVDSITINKGCTLGGSVSTVLNCEMVGTVVPTNGVAPFKYKWFDGGTAQKDSGFTQNMLNQDYVIITDANGCKDSLNFVVPVPKYFTVIPDSGRTVSCAQTCNGWGLLSVYGGTSPYTYLWSNGETVEDPTDLCAGTYTVNISDAHGCKAQVTETLKAVDDSIHATYTAINGSCTTYASACVHPSGGTPPYSYNTPGDTTSCFNNLTAGKSNVVIIDNSGCRYTLNLNVLGGPMSAVITPDDTNICYGTAVTLKAIVTGGMGDYKYQWSIGGTVLTGDTTAILHVTPIANPLTYYTATYTLNVTDSAGCSITTLPNAVVHINDPISANITGIDTIAPGATDILGVTGVYGGTGNYTYLWEPGGSTGTSITTNPTTSQVFKVIISDGCTIPNGVDSFRVFVDTNFNALYIDSLINGSCNNSIWVATNGSVSVSQFNFLWSNGATTDTISGLCAGTYTVSITDKKPSMPNHNPSINKTITIVNPNSIMPVQYNSMFSIYPVPASGKLNIELAPGYKPTANSSVIVYDVTGRQLMKQNVTFRTNIETLDVSGLANGTYLLMLNDGKTTSKAKFTIIQ